LFLGKSTKTAATSAALLTSICVKSFVGWGFAPDPTRGADSAPPGPLAVFRGLTSKRRGGKGRGRGEEGRERRGGGREFVLCPTKKKEKSAPMARRLSVCPVDRQ